jgi:hypothetical protein
VLRRRVGDCFEHANAGPVEGLSLCLCLYLCPVLSLAIRSLVCSSSRRICGSSSLMSASSRSLKTRQKRPSTQFQLSRAWSLYVSITTTPVSNSGMRRPSKHIQRYRRVERAGASGNRGGGLPPKLARSALTIYATHPSEKATCMTARPESCSMAHCIISSPSSINTDKMSPGFRHWLAIACKTPGRSSCQTSVPRT